MPKRRAFDKQSEAAFDKYVVKLIALVYDTGPERTWRDRFDALAKEEQFLVACMLAKIDLDNGGVSQFFGNSSGELYEEAVAGFKWLGYPKAAAALASGRATFGSGDMRDARFRRQRAKSLQEEDPEWDDPATTSFYAAFDFDYLADWELMLGDGALRHKLYPRLLDSRFEALKKQADDDVPPPPKPW